MNNKDLPTSPVPLHRPTRRAEAWHFLQRAYEQQLAGRLDDAVICYKKSLEVHPTAEGHTFLGWTYSFMGRYAEAIRECEQAIQLDPEFGNPYNDIGAYLIELGRGEEAIPWFEQALVAKRYDTRHYPYVNLGRVYEQLGCWPEALRAYTQALTLHPKDPFAVRALARLQGALN
jgi:tetratricopeptide (TPR) repeat protein